MGAHLEVFQLQLCEHYRGVCPETDYRPWVQNEGTICRERVWEERKGMTMVVVKLTCTAYKVHED